MTHTAETHENTANLPALSPDTLPRGPQQFSREDQAFFLDSLAQCGNVLASARATGISRSTAYRMRRACPQFARLWNGALLLARPQVEAVLADRAMNGVEETIFYHGEAVATRIRYDARLLLAHLARLDRLTRDYAASEAADDFDIALNELAGEVEITFVECAPAQGFAGADDSAQAGVDNLPLDTVSGVSGKGATGCKPGGRSGYTSPSIPQVE